MTKERQSRMKAFFGARPPGQWIAALAAEGLILAVFPLPTLMWKAGAVIAGFALWYAESTAIRTDRDRHDDELQRLRDDDAERFRALLEGFAEQQSISSEIALEVAKNRSLTAEMNKILQTAGAVDMSRIRLLAQAAAVSSSTLEGYIRLPEDGPFQLSAPAPAAPQYSIAETKTPLQ